MRPDISTITANDCEYSQVRSRGHGHTDYFAFMIDCLLADMDCLDCSVGACFRERAVQAESVGISSHSPLMGILRRHPQSVALLEGWSIGFRPPVRGHHVL